MARTTASAANQQHRGSTFLFPVWLHNLLIGCSSAVRTVGFSLCEGPSLTLEITFSDETDFAWGVQTQFNCGKIKFRYRTALPWDTIAPCGTSERIVIADLSPHFKNSMDS
jgi:hypothetical protein